jgi:hypothetical protein
MESATNSEPPKSNSKSGFPLQALFVFGLFLGGYWILMLRDHPSIDSNGYYEFNSSARIGEWRNPRGWMLSIPCGRTSFLNYLFYPLDYVYYRSKGMAVRVEQRWRDQQDRIEADKEKQWNNPSGS